MALPNLRGVALLASLVEAFVNVVSITIALVTIITTPPPPSPFHRHHHHHCHQLHHQVSIDSPAPWSLPVTTHRKVVDWHGEDWATQVIFNYCCCCCCCCWYGEDWATQVIFSYCSCCCFCCCCCFVVVVVGTARIRPLRLFSIIVVTVV